MSALDATLGALSDPKRRALVDVLRVGPRRSGELAQVLSLGHPAVSRHLRVLRHAGLVEERSEADDARVRVYRLRQGPFTELRSWLEEVESFWTDQLAAFKAHAESRASAPPTSAPPDERARGRRTRSGRR